MHAVQQACRANRLSAKPTTGSAVASVVVRHVSLAVAASSTSTSALRGVTWFGHSRRALGKLNRCYGSDVEPVSRDNYLCLGVSHCFEKTEDGIEDKYVIEPIGSASLECMTNGCKTSFKYATGVTVAQAMARDRGLLPEQFASAMFCDKFEYRCEAAARTWLRPHAQDNLMDIVPLGKVREDFNFSLEQKRILNFQYIVTDDDNIKQDISIDVYGRKEKAALQDNSDRGVASAQQQKEEEEDELDSLLAA